MEAEATQVKNDTICWCDGDEYCRQVLGGALCATKARELCPDCFYREGGKETKVEQFSRYCKDHDGDRRRFVNVYDISQHYGGPEEGGWWYDWHQCVCTVEALDAADVAVVVEFLEKRFISEGNIHSTRGGTLYQVIAEYEPAESQSKERPHYE